MASTMPRAVQMYLGLPKPIYVLFFARIINRMGGFVNAFLLLFLTVKLGYDVEHAGIYITAVGITAMLGTILGGHLGDRFNRKKTYVIAQALSATLFIPCGFLLNSHLVPVFLMMASFFSSIVEPLNSAMVTDLVSKEDRKSAFSLLYLGINLGVAVGPLIAGFLFEHYIQWIFWGDALTTFIAVFLIYLKVPETKLSKEEMEIINESLDDHEKMAQGGTIKAFLKQPALVFFTLLSIISSFIYTQGGFSLPITLEELFTGHGAKYFGYLMSFNAFVVIFFTVIITILTDRVKAIYNIAAANLLYAIGFGMMAFVVHMPLIVISVFLWTLGEILSVTNTGAYIADHTPITHRSRFNAVISFLRNAGHMVGPVLAGYLIHQYGINVLWIITGVLGIVASTGLVSIGTSEWRKARKIERTYSS